MTAPRALPLVTLLALAGCAVDPRPAPWASLHPSPPPTPTQAPAPSVPPGATTPAGAPDWSIAGCIARAMAADRSITRAQWHVLAQRALLAQANAGRLPTLAADGLAGTRSNDPGAVLGGQDFVTGDRAVAAGDVTAVLPLWNAGDPPGARAAAAKGVQASDEDLQQTRAEVAYAVTTSVLDVLDAATQERLLAASVAALQGEAALAADLQRHGLGLPSDALAAQVREASRDQDRLAMDHRRLAATAHLDRLLGLPITLVPPLPPASVPARTVPAEAALVDEALTGRPDLAAARARAAAATERVRSARAGGLPQLSAVGGYHLTSDHYVLNRQWFSAAMQVEVPLWDGGLSAARTDEAQAQAQDALEAVRDLEDQVREQVHGALLTLAEASARVPVATQAESLAGQRLRLVQDQYRNGVADMTTLLDAEDAHLRAQGDAERARLEVARAWALLRLVSGGATPGF